MLNYLIYLNDISKVVELNQLSYDDLKSIAMSRNVKNVDDLTKKSLIYILLRTEKKQKEHNYLKLQKNNTNTEVKDKINQIRTLLINLNNTLTNKEISPIRRELYEIEKQAIHTEETHQFLENLLDTLKKTQKYRFNDFQDQ